jgi:hypothetical protein
LALPAGLVAFGHQDLFRNNRGHGSAAHHSASLILPTQAVRFFQVSSPLPLSVVAIQATTGVPGEVFWSPEFRIAETTTGGRRRIGRVLDVSGRVVLPFGQLDFGFAAFDSAVVLVLSTNRPVLPGFGLRQQLLSTK